MAIYKRGNKYWYKFMWKGKLIRESTGQGNNMVARRERSGACTRLSKEKDERESAAERMKCDLVLLCSECGKWFDARTAVHRDEQPFCGTPCQRAWIKKHNPIPRLAEFCANRFEPSVRATTAKKTWLDFYGVGLRAINGYSPIANSHSIKSPAKGFFCKSPVSEGLASAFGEQFTSGPTPCSEVGSRMGHFGRSSQGQNACR